MSRFCHHLKSFLDRPQPRIVRCMGLLEQILGFLPAPGLTKAANSKMFFQDYSGIALHCPMVHGRLHTLFFFKHIDVGITYLDLHPY